MPGRDESSRRSGRRSRRRSRSASARRRASSLSAQIMRQDNLPDYGIPGAAWDEEPLAPTTVIAARPVDSTNYYGSVGFDYDKASQDTLHRPHRARRQRAADAAQPDPLPAGRARSGDHRDPESCRVRPGDSESDARAPGQRAREQHHLEPDDRRQPVLHREREPRVDRRAGVQLREAERARARRTRHQARRRHLCAEPVRSGRRLRAGSHRRVDDRPDGHRRPCSRSTRSTLGPRGR